jgi:hypothetical protein
MQEVAPMKRIMVLVTVALVTAAMLVAKDEALIDRGGVR